MSSDRWAHLVCRCCTCIDNESTCCCNSSLLRCSRRTWLACWSDCTYRNTHNFISFTFTSRIENSASRAASTVIHFLVLCWECEGKTQWNQHRSNVDQYYQREKHTEMSINKARVPHPRHWKVHSSVPQFDSGVSSLPSHTARPCCVRAPAPHYSPAGISLISRVSDASPTTPKQHIWLNPILTVLHRRYFLFCHSLVWQCWLSK